MAASAITPDAIIVLGAHRSGTSALAGALHMAGVHFGHDLIGPQQGVNERGMWERGDRE